MPDHVQVRFARIARIEGYPHEVGDAGAEEEVGGFLRVVLQHRDALAGLEPERDQPVRQAATTLPRSGEGQAILAMHDRLPVGEERSRTSHHARHVHARPLLREAREF